MARVDRRTRQLVKRLRRGDIAIIDHVDIDRLAAELLVECGVAAVVNAATSISGRYPNLGPEILVANGIPLVDGVGAGVLAEVRDGDIVRLCDGSPVRRRPGGRDGGAADGRDGAGQAMADARAGLAVQLEAFAANTMEYLRRDRDLLLDGVGVPEIALSLTASTCLSSFADTTTAKTSSHCSGTSAPTARCSSVSRVAPTCFLRLATGRRSLSATWSHCPLTPLRCGAEIVLRTDPDGRAAGLERIRISV